MHLIPPFDHDFTTDSNAERKFAQLLTRVPDDEAVAFHSFHLSRHRIQQMGEADFVVLWDGAVLVLEVKGGRLSRQDGKWYQRGRDGIHVLRKSPLDQAREARWAFSDLIERKLGDDYSYGFALVTPDCMLDDSFELGEHEYLGQTDMHEQGLVRKFDLMASVARRRPGSSQRRPKKDLSPLRKVLRRDLDGMMTLAQQTEMVERRRAELLDEQIDFLEASRANPRIVLEGGAGTGKTLVGLEGARREALEGARVTFVCSTRDARERAQRTVGPGVLDLVLQAELPLTTPAELLVLDEAQDMMNAEDLDRVFNSVAGGLDDGRWWLLADFNNQAHVDGAFDEDSYQLITTTGNSSRIRLARNVRNTEPVIEATQIYLAADVGTARVGPGPAVTVVKAPTTSQATSQAAGRIRRLRQDGVSPRQVAVVVLDHDDLSISTHGTPRELEGVRVWTPTEIKGLEMQHVLVVGLADLSAQRHSNLAYVAMTRATVSLWMAVSPDAYTEMTRMASQHLAQRTARQ